MTSKEIYEWFLSLRNEGITRDQLAKRAKLTESAIGEFVRKYKLFLAGELDKNNKPYKEPGLKYDTFVALQKAYKQIKAEKQPEAAAELKSSTKFSDTETQFDNTEQLNDSVDALRNLYRRSTPAVRRAFLASLMDEEDHSVTDVLKKTSSS